MQKIILIITGSIAANKGIELYEHLKKDYQIDLFLTQNAHRFIEKVPNLSQKITWRTYDLIIAYPASQNFIAKIAHGFSDDLPSQIFKEILAPKFVFPAMNTNMYNNPANLRNLKILRNRQVHIFEPQIGMLACKVYGLGRAWEWNQVAQQIDNFLKVGGVMER